MIATATFGLEAVVKREIEKLGYPILKSEDGRITYEGDPRAIAKSNLWLRCADRVLLKAGEFQAETFEELFEKTKALPWASWIPEDGKFTVSGASVKSKLHSVPDCQSIVKKAIVEKLKEAYHCSWFEETGASYPVKVSILKDQVLLTIDTSGDGLHKRGYRVKNVQAPMKETLAAALIQLSFWKEGRLLVDPFCGSGTIPIEAAMIGINMAPGLTRKFISEDWFWMDASIWQAERELAIQAMDHTRDIRIQASDIDGSAVKAAIENAQKAGVDKLIEFRVMGVSKLKSTEPYGIVLCNPPYGERIGEKEELLRIYKAIKGYYKENPTWSFFLITSDKELEKLAFGKPADRRRKLYNGRLEACYYQYLGLKKVNG